MNKLFLSLLVLLCIMHWQSFAEKAGDVRWSLVNDLSPGADSIHSIKVQPDGKIVVAGNCSRGSYVAIAVGRYAGKVLDSSFGINGIVTASLDSAHIAANALEIQPDGKILVAGSYRKGPASDFILARFKPDGSADSSFGVNGIVRTDISSDSSDVATALAIQSDGRLVAAGRSGSSLAVCRYNTDGSPDSSFDADGKRTAAVAGATCMKLQTDGKLVVCCGDVVIRLMPDGSLDYSFGTNAVATLTDYFYGIAIQKDGKILVSGGNKYQWVLERLDTAGVHDNSFGNGGIVKTTGFYPNGANAGQGATSVCLQADGRIVASGWVQFSLSVFMSFAVARYQANGAPDSSFGTLGRVASLNMFFPNTWRAVSLSAAINNDNELVIGGTNFNNASLVTEWALASYYLGLPLAVHTVPGLEGQIIVAPNPAEDLARIQSRHIENGPWRLSLCDLTGRTLYSEMVGVTNNAFDKSISLIGLPAAMYLVKLDNGISRMTVKLTKSR